MTNKNYPAVGFRSQVFYQLGERLAGSRPDSRAIGIELNASEDYVAIVFRFFFSDYLAYPRIKIHGYTSSRYPATCRCIGLFIKEIGYSVSIAVRIQTGVDSVGHIGFCNGIRIGKGRVVDRGDQLGGTGIPKMVASFRSVGLSRSRCSYGIFPDFICERYSAESIFIFVGIPLVKAPKARLLVVLGKRAYGKVYLFGIDMIVSEAEADINTGRYFIMEG